MSYEDAVEIYWRRNLKAGGPAYSIRQPSRSESVWTGKGWSLRNINGILGYVYGGKR